MNNKKAHIKGQAAPKSLTQQELRRKGRPKLPAGEKGTYEAVLLPKTIVGKIELLNQKNRDITTEVLQKYVDYFDEYETVREYYWRLTFSYSIYMFLQNLTQEEKNKALIEVKKEANRKAQIEGNREDDKEAQSEGNKEDNKKAQIEGEVGSHVEVENANLGKLKAAHIAYLLKINTFNLRPLTSGKGQTASFVKLIDSLYRRGINVLEVKYMPGIVLMAYAKYIQSISND